MFISFEGCEGAGKTTQIKKLAAYLEDQGKEVVITREPGGSAGGELIRELLVKGDVNRWDNITEVLLFFASRRDHVEKTIKPALNQGKVVISDRFADSTTAYQLYGYRNENVTKEGLDTIYEFTLGEFKPDLTIIMDISAEDGMARKIAQNELQRFEKKGIEFHNNLRNGYLEIAKENPNRCKVIDASLPMEQVTSDIIELLK